MGLIATTCETVPAPELLTDAGRVTNLAEELARCGYNLANCAMRLGVHPRLGVNFWPVLRRAWQPDENDPVDTLIELFVDGREVGVDRLSKHVSAAFIDAVVATRLAGLSGSALQSKLCLFPCFGKYVVTDRAAKNTAINQVMWLWAESFILAAIANRIPRRRAIDLGTGSGVHAILASSHCDSVVAVDISPRALEFARFNAALNGIKNVEFIEGDLFQTVDSTFDLLLANPPYLPDGAAQPGDNFWSGGVNGAEILGRIVGAIPARLDPDGAAHIVALYPCAPGKRVKDLFDSWLDGAVDRYEVLDHSWPAPSFQDLLSDMPYQGDKTAWRFGVISLRRAQESSGWWKQAPGNGLFFLPGGSSSVVADHDLF